MDRIDDENLVLDTDDEVLRIIHWGRWILGGIMLIIFALFITGWVLRKGVAKRAMAEWCAKQSLTCTADFEDIGPAGAELRNLEIRAGNDVPLRADRVSAVLDWPGFFRPKLTSVSITEPVLRGQFKDGRLTLFGLEELAKGGGTQSGAAPLIEVINGHVVIATDAGDVTARAMIQGALPQNGEMVLTLDPANLSGPDGRIQWTGGDVNILAKDGRLDGIVSLRLETAALNGLTLEGGALEARIETDSALEELNIVDLSGTVQTAQWGKGHVSNLELFGSATFDGVPKMSVSEARQALQTLAYDVRADEFAIDAFSGTNFDFAGTLGRDDEMLTGSVAVTANEVVAPQGRVGALNSTGTAQLPDKGGVAFQGRASVQSAGLGAIYREPVTDRVVLPSALDGHGRTLRRALDRLLQDFDTSVDISIEQFDAGTKLRVKDNVEIQGARGGRITVAPATTDDWFVYDRGNISAAGTLKMSGGGLPDLMAIVDHSKIQDGQISLKARQVRLAPWTASGRTISGQMSVISVETVESGMMIDATGTIGLSGAFPGASIDTTQVSGQINASSTNKVWTIKQTGRKCLGIETQGVTAGAAKLGQMNFSACPQANTFLRNGKGSLTLGDVSVPLSTEKSHGTLSLSSATLDYDATRGVNMTVLADHMSLPMMLGERRLTIEGKAPRFGVVTGRGTPRLSARLGQTEFGGAMIPARISATAFTFDGAMPATGISGKFTADSLVVSDYRDDPLYQPLIMDMDAKLVDGWMQMSAPVRLKRGGITVADADIDLDILKLNGDATVRTRTLTFKQGGLQPHMLSDRLRGLFTTATGALEGQADLKITGGKLSATGRVQVTGFGFQTQRLGRVIGVNGTVNFTDLLGMTTAPDQVVTVRSLNPGVPLQDGRLAFQLERGKTLKVSEAVFPFAGGKMTLLPMDWELGGTNQAFEVVASDIKLEELISSFKLPDVKATGTVGGRFPVSIEDSKVLIKDARLVASPEGGQLSYTGKVSDQAAAAGEYGEMAFEALKMLQYKVLELGLNGNVAGDMRVDLLLIGKNNEVLNGQPFEFDISVDSKLAELIQARLYYVNQEWLDSISSGDLPAGGRVQRDE